MRILLSHERSYICIHWLWFQKLILNCFMTFFFSDFVRAIKDHYPYFSHPQIFFFFFKSVLILDGSYFELWNVGNESSTSICLIFNSLERQNQNIVISYVFSGPSSHTTTVSWFPCSMRKVSNQYPMIPNILN